jgi:hypothetical protein
LLLKYLQSNHLKNENLKKKLAKQVLLFILKQLDFARRWLMLKKIEMHFWQLNTKKQQQQKITLSKSYCKKRVAFQNARLESTLL